MNHLINEVVNDLNKQGYIGTHVSCKPSFHTAIASFDMELLSAQNLPPDNQPTDSVSYLLSLDMHHYPTHLDISLNFSYQLSENADKLQCRRVSAVAGEASREFKINYDHPMPSLDEVVQTLQQRLQKSPFLRQLDTMLDNMKDYYYGRIKFAESNKPIVDVIRKKVQLYHAHQDSGRTRLLKVPGKYHLLRNRMDTNIILELNKEKLICQIKQIENVLEDTKMIFLPGRKQHLDTPFEMLSLLTEKHDIEKRIQTAKRLEEPSSVHERLAKKR